MKKPTAKTPENDLLMREFAIELRRIVHTFIEANCEKDLNEMEQIVTLIPIFFGMYSMQLHSMTPESIKATLAGYVDKGCGQIWEEVLAV